MTVSRSIRSYEIGFRRHCFTANVLPAKVNVAIKRSCGQLKDLIHLWLGIKLKGLARSWKDRLKCIGAHFNRGALRLRDQKYFSKFRYVSSCQLLRRTFHLGQCKEWEHCLCRRHSLSRKFKLTDSFLRLRTLV